LPGGRRRRACGKEAGPARGPAAGAVTPEFDDLDAAIAGLRAANAESLRALRREYSHRLRGASSPSVLRLAYRLLDRGGSARRFIAYELVHHHRAALASLGEREIARLGRGLQGWGDVDAFACYLAGPAWRERQMRDAVIRRWARSPDRWRRRAALVSTVPLNSRARGGCGDARRTLAVCRLLLADRDDMVVKALSWALRELAKREPGAVESFLAEHGRALAPRVVREVRNKLATGLKNPRRAARAAARR
jgi:3-methyladenine DNA glycosylase AlkD